MFPFTSFLYLRIGFDETQIVERSFDILLIFEVRGIV